MRPTLEQIEALARLIIDTRPQEITCDDLLDLVGHFAELELADEEIPPELQPVVDHLRLCPECSEELEALRRALRGG